MTKSSPNLKLETEFRAGGKSLIAGLDEVGRGAWAGPVVAAAAVLPLDRIDLEDALTGVRDSKQCTARQRIRLDNVIRSVALAASVGVSTAQEIDDVGIAAATRLAMRRALEMLSIMPDALLIDYVRLLSVNVAQKSLPKGDQKSLSIAAASIIAKVSRDQMMESFHQQYPNYGFNRHKGYGTLAHQIALKNFGHCPIHRLSFSPLRQLLITE